MSTKPEWSIIPPSILKNARLTPMQKIIAGKIIELADADGICIATNDELAEKIGVPTHTIDHATNQIFNNCRIKRVFSGPRKLGRELRIPAVLRPSTSEFESVYITYIENKNKRHNTKDPVIEKKRRAAEEIKETILNHLNTGLGLEGACKFRSISPAPARMADGATLADLLLVIDHKIEEWAGNDAMESYIQPSTLFGIEKFPRYLRAALKWESNGRPTISNGKSNASVEIKEEIQGQIDRLRAQWDAYVVEEDFIRNNGVTTDMARLGEITKEKNLIEEKAKRLKERLKAI